MFSWLAPEVRDALLQMDRSALAGSADCLSAFAIYDLLTGGAVHKAADDSASAEAAQQPGSCVPITPRLFCVLSAAIEEAQRAGCEQVTRAHVLAAWPVVQALEDCSTDRPQWGEPYDTMLAQLDREYLRRKTKSAVAGSDALISVTYELTYDDWREMTLSYFRHWVWSDHAKVQRLIAPAAFLVALGLGWIVRSWGSLQDRTEFLGIVLLFLAAPAYVLLGLLYYRRKLDRWHHASRKPEHIGTFTVVIHDVGLTVERRGTARLYPWGRLRGIHVAPGYLFLEGDDGGGLAVPWRAFSDRRHAFAFQQWLANLSGVVLVCPRCAYDLRGAASGRCSECGFPD